MCGPQELLDWNVVLDHRRNKKGKARPNKSLDGAAGTFRVFLKGYYEVCLSMTGLEGGNYNFTLNRVDSTNNGEVVAETVFGGKSKGW